jgi:hypothetical protein
MLLLQQRQQVQQMTYAPLATNVALGDWAAEHIPTGPEVFSTFAPALGDMFTRSVADKIELFGYSEHTNETTWVGSKGGLAFT